MEQNFTTELAIEWYNSKLISKTPQLLLYKDYLAAKFGKKELIENEFGQRVEREVKTVYSFRSIGPK